MISDPLDSVTILLAGEDVEAYLGPTVDALGQLEGLMLLMVGRDHAVDGLGLAGDGVV